MDEFRALLDRFWIRREEDRELFYQVRRKLPALRRALREQFGWEVICTEQVIRLVKEPARAQEAFGIPEFTEVQDYCLLCGVLLLLEDKDDGQRFLLSELTQAVLAYTKPWLPDLSWERYSCRTSLVRVLQYAERLGLLRSFEGESDGFAVHQDQEVLYENTGLCRYFSVHFHRDITGYTSVRDFENPPEDGPDQERGTFRTWRVYRQLALAPAVYWEDPGDSLYAYIKNQRGILQRNLDETIGGKLQIYHNGAFFLPEEGEPCGNCFPRDQMRSDILLLLSERLSEKINCGAFLRDPDDRVHLTRLFPGIGSPAAGIQEPVGQNGGRKGPCGAYPGDSGRTVLLGFCGRAGRSRHFAAGVCPVAGNLSPKAIRREDYAGTLADEQTGICKLLAL